ncbi:hypothetical protein BLIG_00464 [Bifidobacterium longum subsp. infantis CCUG 52486]|uniref:Uncharacterized protein n=1 Tax=Bifidobacterium longum subsp. infantis CCUG 52486 TaxID=537937 RepID=C5E921_BIFLI|nr:hypothetical protein BLIG_00464 [Bifidobacterium longum subsp. infantis CCUG 52486]
MVSSPHSVPSPYHPIAVLLNLMGGRYMSVYIAEHRAYPSRSGNVQKPSRNLVNKFQNAFRSAQRHTISRWAAALFRQKHHQSPH